ncbi:IRGM isoform 3, partial [Pan troglodytes]
NHVMLAKTAEDMGKKFYIVWTKLDLDLSTGALPEVQLLQIRENVLENLQKERSSRNQQVYPNHSHVPLAC